ncbi:MAG: carbohydrate-binding family 9-like protein [Edaphobacter sp.]
MNRLAMLCLLVMTGAACAQSAAFKSVYSPHDVSLGTKPDSAFWRGALPVYAELDTHGKVVPGYRTEVRSRWTKGNLYLLYICPYEELNLKPSPSTTTETNQLWNWDVAEIFIGSDFKNIRRYKEFEVSPQGEWIDLDIDLDLPDHEVGWKWNSGFQVTARIDRKAKIWYAAMRIPFAAIDPRAPAAGSVFRANLFRSQGPPPRQKQITWKAPMTATFHTPERFGQLELVMAK